MAQVGLKYLVCAPITETENEVEYDGGLVMSRAIKVDMSIEINEAKLYSDDRVTENIREFKSGKVTLNGDHLEYEVLSLILGHKVETLQGGGKKLTAHADDEGEYVGIGFYSTTLKSGVKKYRSVWLRKVKFGIPNESLETKGDNINFQTPSIEGAILTDILGNWKEEATFNTENEAKAWLDNIADIGGGSGG